MLVELLRQDLSLKLELSVPLGWLTSELPWVSHPALRVQMQADTLIFSFHDSTGAETRSSCLYQHLFTGSFAILIASVCIEKSKSKPFILIQLYVHYFYKFQINDMAINTIIA